jgi:hypothetical protein
VVALESLLELIPSHSVASLHGLEVVPPHQSFPSQLQHCEVRFVLLGASSTKAENFASMALTQASLLEGFLL